VCCSSSTYYLESHQLLNLHKPPTHSLIQWSHPVTRKPNAPLDRGERPRARSSTPTLLHLPQPAPDAETDSATVTRASAGAGGSGGDGNGDGGGGGGQPVANDAPPPVPSLAGLHNLTAGTRSAGAGTRSPLLERAASAPAGIGVFDKKEKEKKVKTTGRVQGGKPPTNPSGIVLVAVTAVEPLDLTKDSPSKDSTPGKGGVKRKSSNFFGKDKEKVTFLIVVGYSDGRTDRVWRRRAQFQDLRDTVEPMLPKNEDDSGPATPLPKLTAKPNIGTSIRGKKKTPMERLPELQELLWALLWLDDPVVMQIFAFFLRVTEDDNARAAHADAATPKIPGRISLPGDEKSTVKQLVAIHPHQAADSAELTFDKGDLFEELEVLGNDWVDVRATTGVGTRGLVPRNHLIAYVAEAAAKATNPADELVMSEEFFYNNLVEVKDAFFPRLRALLTAPEAATLFGNWAELIPLSHGLMQALKANRTDLAAVLIKHLPGLQAPFVKYCGRITKAQDLYSTKLLEPSFVQFEESFTDLNKPTLNHLMRPVISFSSPSCILTDCCLLRSLRLECMCCDNSPLHSFKSSSQATAPTAQL
jgi:hypothetical protein